MIVNFKYLKKKGFRHFFLFPLYRKMEIKIMPKNAEFHCKFCDFKCSKKSNFETHSKTKKHMYRLNGNNMENAEIKKCQSLTCECGKNFSTSSGLWKHKQKCQENIDDNIKNHDKISDKELIMMLVKQNSELIKETSDFKNIMMEVIKNGTHNTINNNSHNKSFNLNVFLNETCKDAMNIMDFVDSVKLQLSDLESVGKLGYVDGISNIIVKNLKALDVHKRPVHCTDSKREIIYIKDQDKWEKEDEENKKIRKVIKKVATKNACLLPKFKEAHPDCSKSSSQFSDQYNKIIVESMGGSGDNDLEKEDKIIKNVAKQILIDKEKYSNII